ncbi:MAG: hypothetical protein KDJ14_01190 [Xanthomonadales bacterium]|nr:hypothetical protein [Xanthomonadales bacterium]
MRNIIKGSIISLALVGLMACGKSEQGQQKQQEATPAVLTAPTDGNEQSWKLYIAGVVKQNMKGVRNSPYLYYLPPATVEDFEDQYARQLDNVSGVIARTVQPGNMLAFGSPEAGRMADLVVDAFAMADPGSFKGVKVLVIGKAEDNERIKEAIAPSDAEYIFVEMN